MTWNSLYLQPCAPPVRAFPAAAVAAEALPLFSPLRVLVLYPAVVRRDRDTGDAFHDSLCGNDSLGLTNIARPAKMRAGDAESLPETAAQGTKRRNAPKEELPVEVGDVDGVHINNIDVLQAAQS